jgi:hypothetical protein
MMGKKRRPLYQLRYPGRGPAYLEDVGNRLKISGLVLQGEEATFIVMTPQSSEVHGLYVEKADLETWSELLRQSDDPLIFEQEEGGREIKAVHRKVRFAISGAIQQWVWARDFFRCAYCGREMDGRHVQLTVDHFVPLELGGANDESNYLSACRKCNKDKGAILPEEFCRSKGLDYDGLVLYLSGKAPMSFVAHLTP